MKETIGKVAVDGMLKDHDTRSVVELEQEMQKEYMNELLNCIDAHYNKWTTDFYVSVITKREVILHNVLRNYFTARLSCPTPTFDQSVFKYHRQDGKVEYLWTVPSEDACIHMKENALAIVDEERPLFNFVLQFSDGTLLKLAKKLNGEEEKSIALVSGSKLSGAQSVILS